MAAAYSPGTPTLARQIGENVFAIDSFRGEAQSYTVTLGEHPACDCPHFQRRLAGKPGSPACKHIVSARTQSRFARRLAIARTLPDAQLQALLVKYTEKGDAEVSGALRVAREERRRATQADALLLAVFA